MSYVPADTVRKTAEEAYEIRVKFFQSKIRENIKGKSRNGFFYVNIELTQPENDLVEDEIVALREAGYHVASHLPKSITISWTG